MTTRQYTDSKFSADNLRTDWRFGTAYIVESRPHKNLSLVLNNVASCLPSTWGIWVFHSEENQAQLESITKSLSRSISLIKLENTISENVDYNTLLLSSKFWQQFQTENLLGFQVDALLNLNQKHRLEELCTYDYVGAPWSESIRQRWPYVPDKGGNGGNGGNGGVCFSKKSARLRVLEASTTPRNSVAPHHQELNEDIWFSQAFIDQKMRLPEYEVACSLMVESVYSEKPFSAHKPWLYLEASQYDRLAIEIPSLELLSDGCGEQRKHPSLEVDMRKFFHRYARACMNSENYYQADLALQLCHSRFPEDIVSYNLHALLASKLDLNQQALSFLDQALTIKSDFKKALENRAVIELKVNKEKAIERDSKTKKYLLINSWGSGFGFDLLYLMQQLLLAEITHRTPVVYWGENSLYNPHPERNCFTDYFLEISQNTIDDLIPLQEKAFPEYWQDQALNKYLRRTRWRNTANNQSYQIMALSYLAREEELVISGEFSSIKVMLPWLEETSPFHGQDIDDIYRSLMLKYLKFQPEIVKRAEGHIKNLFGEQSYYSIHLRGTDKQQEKQSQDIASINIELMEQLEKLDSTKPIFVMSDDVKQVELAKTRFGSRVKTIDVTRITGDSQGVHHLADDKSKIAHEVILDMLIASNAHTFLGCGFSYLACCVAYRRSKKVNTILHPFNILSRFYEIPYPGKFGIS